MTDKPDDSGGFCCVGAGMHMGHDKDCPARAVWARGPTTHWADCWQDTRHWACAQRRVREYQARVELLENLLVNWLVAIVRSGEHRPSIEKETVETLRRGDLVRSDTGEKRGQDDE